MGKFITREQEKKNAKLAKIGMLIIAAGLLLFFVMMAFSFIKYLF